MTTVHDVAAPPTRACPPPSAPPPGRALRRGGHDRGAPRGRRRRAARPVRDPRRRASTSSRTGCRHCATRDDRRTLSAPPTVLCFGTLRRNKGIPELLAAIERIGPDAGIRFRIAGRGDADLEAAVAAAAARLPQLDAELEWITPDRKVELFRAADLAVLPYTAFSSQSGVLHDAFGSHLPAVVTDVGALPASVARDRRGLVGPGRLGRRARRRDHGRARRSRRRGSARPMARAPSRSTSRRPGSAPRSARCTSTAPAPTDLPLTFARTPYAVPIAARIAFHIGYHKTATTWFQFAAMPRHPGIRPLFTEQPATDPLLRELVLTPRHSFDVDRARAALDTRLAELAVPEDGIALGSQERLSGHAATGGFDTFDIAERLALVAPDALVFAVVREQVAMIESEYLQLLQEGSLRPLDRCSRRPDDVEHAGVRPPPLRVRPAGRPLRRAVRPRRLPALRLRRPARRPARLPRRARGPPGDRPVAAIGDDVLRRRFNPTVPRRLLGLRRFLNHFERRPLNHDPVVAVAPVGGVPSGGSPRTGRAGRARDRRRARERAPRALPRVERATAERHGFRFVAGG